MEAIADLREEDENFICVHGLPALADCPDCDTIFDAEFFTCGIFGHDIVDDSVAGPDTGNTDWRCLNCWYSGYETLY